MRQEDMANWENLNGILVPKGISLTKAQQQEKQADEARSQRGKFFSSYAWTQNNAGLGYNKPANTVSFEVLRSYAERSLIDKIIINARIMQMKHVAKRVVVPGKQLGFRVVHKQYADPNYKADDATLKRCKEMEDIIDSVNDEVHPNGFRDFAAICVDQELTIDRKAMVITRDRGSRPSRYHLVDGATIRPVLEVIFDEMNRKKLHSKDAAIMSIYNTYSVDVSSAAYVQIIDGHIVASWTKEEMSIDITNPSVEINKWAYGKGSMLEQSLQGTSTWLSAWNYNDGLFNQDSPESLLFLYGDYDPIGLDAFKRQILDQTGSGDYQKIPVIPADTDFKAELIKIRELPKDLQFAEFLRMIIQIKTAAFRAHPSIVNMSIDKGGGGGLSIGGSNEDEIVNAAHEEGFETLAENICQWLTRTIIRPRYDDLVMIMDLDTEDEDKRVDTLNKQLLGGMTFNEWRHAQGLDGDLEFGDSPGNPQYVALMSAAQAQQAQDQQQQQAKDTTKNSPTPKDQFAHEKEKSDREFDHQTKQADRDHELKTKELDIKTQQVKQQAKQKTMKKHDIEDDEKVLVIEILN